MNERQHIMGVVHRMKAGEAVNIYGRELRQAFPGGASLFGTTTLGGPMDHFLSNCMGSAYGSVRIRHDEFRDVYVITKHEPQEFPDGRRFFVDHDRRHLYDRTPDGMWIRNSVPFVRPH